MSNISSLDYTFDFHSADFESEKVKERVFMRDWNPVSYSLSDYPQPISMKSCSLCDKFLSCEIRKLSFMLRVIQLYPFCVMVIALCARYADMLS